MARFYFTTVLVLTFFISLVSSQIDTVEFVQGDDLSITCNADEAGVDNGVTRITSTKLLYGTEEMVYLQQQNGIFPPVRRTGSQFSAWTFDIPSIQTLQTALSASPNRDSITIRANNTNAQCSDSGIFKCIVGYPENNVESFTEKDTNYTGRGVVNVRDMTVSPFRADNLYDVNDTVTLKCVARGPQGYEFRWHEMCPTTNNFISPSFVPWPNASDIQTLISLSENNDCNTYSYTQELIFMAQLQDNDCQIRCQFGHVQTFFIAADSSNVTILVKTNAGGALPSSDNSSSASSEALAIGLGVGLTLLVLIIIIVLVYVFWFRKRSKDDKYKGSGQDNPDANNLGSNAPPPVFYSKPNKQLKSEKNEARGASIGSEDSYPYEKDIRRKPYFDDEHPGLDTDPRGPPRSGRRRSNRRSRGDSVDDSDKEPPRSYPHDQRRSYKDDPSHDYDNQPYASTDISRSEDEYSDASGRPRPKPKRRTKYSAQDGDGEKELHYADLDLPQRHADNNRGDRRDEPRYESGDPIHYASIRV